MAGAFTPFANILESIALGLAGLGIAIVALGLVILAIMNAFSILDPRAGAQVKTGLIKLIITGAFLGMGAGITALATAISTG